MEINQAIDKSLISVWQKSKLIDKADYYSIEKILKSNGDNGSRSHIKNVIENSYTTTSYRREVIILFYQQKQSVINEQKKIASQWEK